MANKNKKPHIHSTSDLANAFGIHPNTVRMYEAIGYLPPAPRSPKGYRLFSRIHFDQLRIIRTTRGIAPLGKGITNNYINKLVRCSAGGDIKGALDYCHQIMDKVISERRHAEAAAEYLQKWAEGAVTDFVEKPLRIGQVAKLLDTTIDSLRNWERNSLIRVPRDPVNGYRLYGTPEIGRLRVIRMLIRSGYSMMAILRTLLCHDKGKSGNLRRELDTPRRDEKFYYAKTDLKEDAQNVYYTSDRWLTTLNEVEQAASETISLLKKILNRNRNGKTGKNDSLK